MLAKALRSLIGLTSIVALILLTLGSWGLHVVYTIQHEAYLLLIAGAIMPPVGIVHGWMIMLGVPWV
jgi:hypothetical protein